MRKPTTRLFALVLCVLLLVSQLGLADSVAAETEDLSEPVQTSEQFEPAEQSEPAEEPVTDPVEEPVEAPAEEPVEAPAEEPVEEPVEEPIEAPAEEPVEVPVEEPEPEITEAPAPEVTETPAPEVTETPAPEATETPAPEVTVEPTAVPTVEPTEEPVMDPPEEPEPEIATIAGIMPMALAEAGEVTLTVTTDPTSVVAGTPLTKITLTAEDGTFNNISNNEGYFSLSDDADGASDGLSITGVSAAGNTATLTIDGTPKTAGKIFVNALGGAFTDETVTGGTATITVEPAPDPTVEASGELTAGVAGGKITLTIESSDNTFDSTDANNYTLDGGLSVSSVEASGTTATLTVREAPTAAGSVTVTVQPGAFQYRPANAATVNVNVDPAPTPKVTAGGTLTAGTAGGTIDLEITGGDNTFALNTPTLYTLACDNGDNLTVESVTLGAGSGDNTKATLKVKEAPTKKGSVSVTIAKDAFTYQPSDGVTTNSVEIAGADVSVEASGTLTAGVPGGSITITSTGINFADDVGASMFSFEPEVKDLAIGGELTGGSDSVTLTITGTPQTPNQELTVKIQPAAFQYQPDTPVTTSVTVAAPSGTITAELSGEIYAGTAVGYQEVTLTIKEDSQGLTFKSDLSDKSAFTLSENGSLAIESVSFTNGTKVTLTLEGTPEQAGAVTITADKDQAFTIAPDTAPTATINVTAAPTVELTAETATITAGIDKTITIKISSDNAKFVSSPNKSLFTISSDTITPTPNVTNVEANETSATLTLEAAPSKDGSLKVTVDKTAFDPVAGNEPTTDVTVDALTGKVTASTSATFTAGTDATDKTITLAISEGKLTFKETGLEASNFQLGDGNTGLLISNVSWTDATHVTLTLSGTPEKGGSFDVTVNTSAFTVEPTDGNAVKATPSIEVGYPNITLKATAESEIYEDEAISEANNTITLKATGGIFNITSDKTYFSISGVDGVTLDSVEVAEEGTTATLTLSGTPKGTGPLTITVKKGAFKYQPEEAQLTATVAIHTPTGSITATLDGKLYAGTPLPEDGQTVTIAIKEGSHGMVFKSTQVAGNFSLSDGSGLTITDAKFDANSNTVTLTLTGTPKTAGTITITAADGAFEFSPEGDEEAEITVEAAPTVTLDTNPESIVAGIEKEITILLTSENENVKFVNAPQPTWFKLSNSDLSVDQVKVGSDSKSVTLTLSAAPSKDGVLTVTVDPQAFNIRPVSDLTATITIYALYGKVSATLTGTLTAGTEVTGQTITLEITDTNGLTFKDGVENTDFKLETGSEGLEIGSVDKVDDKTVTLTLSGTPNAAGTFTVTALRDSAFTVPPTATSDVTATGDIKIGYPTITVTAAPYEDIYEGVDIANNTITVTATGGVFDGDTLDNNITISGHDELTLQSVAKGQGDNIVILNLRGIPTSTDDLTITIQPGAFTYQPEDTLTAAVPVLKPTGKVTATLNGEPLYAGTPVNGQTVTLTIGESTHGLQFKDETELEISEFMLKGDAAAGLTIDAVTWDSDTQVTLTLGGTPTAAGDFEVDAEDSAFTYSPGMEEPAGTFTVNPAPEITLTADPASVTAGLELGAVTVTAEGGTFLAQLDASLFAISSPDGIAEGMEITGVTVVDGTTVTLTVTGAPAKDGTLIVTADREAFVIRPESSPEAKIAVAKLTGSVSMALAGGELTAGTAADGLTLELAAAGEGLTFGADAAPGGFLLTGPGAEGLTVASVTRTDETHVTLTLSGTPAKAGELGVTVTVAAFAVPPTDGQDVTAAPSVTVAYPTVTVTADPASVSQGVDIDTITLTAVGGVFNAIDGGTDGFGISGVTGVTLVAVSATDGGDTATLTVTGAPGQTGTLTVTVQPEAFKYQPEKAVTAAITVTGPTGTVAAVLSDALYANTPVNGQTITVTISDSKGLSFKDGLTPDSFQLTGAAATGLTVSGVTGSGASVTLTLSGTPAAGSFTVTALENAFTFDPGQDMDAGTVSVNAAPEVSVTAEPETLTAGEAVGTITITAVGGTFAPTADASLFALSGYGASGLTVSAVTVEGSTATLTITGAPENAGTLTVTVSRAAFSPVAAGDPTVEITVRAGSISTDVETGEGAPAASFGSTVDELADAVLDPEEQALLAQGATVTITLQEQDISASVSAADKAAVEAAAGDYTIGEYLDVTLIKSVNDKPSAVHETSKPIIVVFSVPTALQGANRQFAVVRVHEGTGTLLNDLDSDPNTITIATDLFSTYAIVYRDAPETPPSDVPATPPSDAPETPPSDTPEPTPTEKPAPAAAATSAPTAPDTGDEAAPALWLGLLALCAGALVLTGGLLRRRSGTR